MHLETALDPRLWNTVRASLEARKFTAAILDGIHLLTDVIRERSGLEGDGVALVGAAFGGNAPKLKLNRLQSETEQNIQRGTEAMLRGFYQAVRNPRSHETWEDEERDATALILFVDYLLRVVDKAGTPFSVQSFVARVLDPHFVPSDRYAKLLVTEIPAKKRLAVCREVFACRAIADTEKVGFFFDAVLEQMPADDTEELCNLVSQELQETADEDTIRFVVAAFPSAIWPRLDEIARLRIENRLIEAVWKGRWQAQSKQCTQGGLGTWASRILRELTLKDEFWRAAFSKLGSSNVEEQDYVFRYFMPHVENCFDAPPAELRYRVNKGLREGDRRYKDLVGVWRINHQGLLDEAPKPDHPWIKPFADAWDKFKQAPEPAPEPPEMQEIDIPF